MSVVPGVQVASQLFEAALTGRLGGAEGAVGMETACRGWRARVRARWWRGAAELAAGLPKPKDIGDGQMLDTCWFCSISNWPLPRLIPTFEPDCVIAACTAAKLLKP